MATVQVGNNSDQGGAPEFSLGGAGSLGQRTWDSDLSDGFDSGPVGVALDASSGGAPDSISFSVGGGTLTSNLNFNTINCVEIKAFASNGGKMKWSEITVTFYIGDQPQQPIVIPVECNPEGPPKQTLRITPDGQGSNRVVISATVQLSRVGTTLPGPGDMVGTIQVVGN